MLGCGRDHPTGLLLEMWGLDDELRVRGSFTVTEHHQGAPGLAHGGVISAAVDEGMGYLLWLVGSPAVTARLEVDFRRPVPVAAGASRPGGPPGGTEDLGSMQGRVDNEVAVEAQALYVMVGLEYFVPHAERMGERMAERPYNP